MACNLKTEKLLDCVLMEVCAVIGLNAVCFHGENKKKMLTGYPSYLELWTYLKIRRGYQHNIFLISP